MTKSINKIDFYKHLRIYLTWCVLFFVINKVTSPNVNWFIYPILGWGISVFIQA
ncbi:MAG: 2TM domain-containing protein, partial [Bacteroidota bacterium]